MYTIIDKNELYGKFFALLPNFLVTTQPTHPNGPQVGHRWAAIWGPDVAAHLGPTSVLTRAIAGAHMGLPRFEVGWPCSDLNGTHLGSFSWGTHIGGVGWGDVTKSFFLAISLVIL